MSGGGARAAYQVGVLRAVARRCPGFRPRIITGVSAGAINAASLASFEGSFPAALDHLSEMWEGLRTEDVLRTDSPSLSRIGLRWARRLLSSGHAGREAHGLVDTTPLRLLLMHHLDPRGDGLRGIGRNIAAGRLDAVGITATNYATGQTVTWIEGESGAVRRMPPSPYHALPTRTAGKKIGSAAEAITCSTRMGSRTLRRFGSDHASPLSPSIHVTVWPVA